MAKIYAIVLVVKIIIVYHNPRVFQNVLQDSIRKINNVKTVNKIALHVKIAQITVNKF